MSSQLQLFLVQWKEPDSGLRENRTTPYLGSGCAALLWLIRQRPYLLQSLHEIEVRPWRRGDPR